MAYRSSSSLAGTGVANSAVPVPAGAAIGDIAVVALYLESTATITPPAGFTNKADLATSPTARGRLAVYWKRLTAADSGTYAFTHAATFHAAAAGLWSGRIATGDPFSGTVGTAESTVTVTTLNVSTSPAVANGDAIGFWTNFNGGAGFTQPTNYTERQDVSVITLDTRDAVASGSTGNVTATASITDFMKAFLGVLAPAAGGTDATPTPAAIVGTVTAPQATPSADSSKTPAVTVATVAAPVATPAISDSGTPSAVTATTALPQATPVAGGGATAAPAAIAAVVSAPAATPSVTDVAAPAAVSVVVGLPQASALAGGNVTVTPATVAAAVAAPQASRSGTAVASPARIAVTVAGPAATPVVHDTAAPAAIVSLATFLPTSIHGGALRSPAPIVMLYALPSVVVGDPSDRRDIVVSAQLRNSHVTGGVRLSDLEAGLRSNHITGGVDVPRDMLTGSVEYVTAEVTFVGETAASIATATGVVQITSTDTTPTAGSPNWVAADVTERTDVNNGHAALLALKKLHTAGAPGEYYLWAKVTDNPEVPILKCGTFTVR